MKRSGTNPTAAAVAVLTIHSTIGKHLREDVLAYLNDVRGDEGGFQANTRIPFADALSTFTGYLTCLDLDARGLRARVHTAARPRRQGRHLGADGGLDGRAFRAPGDHVFVVKLNYWLSL